VIDPASLASPRSQSLEFDKRDHIVDDPLASYPSWVEVWLAERMPRDA